MKHPCIFVVDDDSGILDSFEIILKKEGYRVFTATNGQELKALLLKDVPNLILMDYHLGKDNGGILAEKIIKDSHTSHVPVIILSANSQYKKAAKLMGANDFIEKPVEIPLLLSKVKKHITHE